METNWIQRGFLLAAVFNILGVLVFSKAFTNPFIADADPVVMSNFGLVMIMLWGLAYAAVATQWQKLPWICLLFAIEKLVYVIAWLTWMLNAPYTLSGLFEQDILTGMFFSIYGLNDAAFMLFFLWAFKQAKFPSLQTV